MHPSQDNGQSPVLSPFQTHAEGWCHTHLKVIKFSYIWVIENYSFCKRENGEGLRSSVFSSDQDDSMKWYVGKYYSILVCLFLVTLTRRILSASECRAGPVYYVTCLADDCDLPVFTLLLGLSVRESLYLIQNG